MTNHTFYWQSACAFNPLPRGFNLITDVIQDALESMPDFKTGLLNLFLQHTSASICLSEYACPDVRKDLEDFFNRQVPEDPFLYRHRDEGPDDMPAHIKNVQLGSSLTIPIKNGMMLLGQWQGIYLVEHRTIGSSRQIILTAHGFKD